MAKTRKLVYSGSSGHSGQNGSGGRLGPPESVEKPEKTRKAGKDEKTRFLRVQGPSATVYTGYTYRGNRHLSVSPRASSRRPSRLLRESPPGDSLQSVASSLHWGRLRLPQTPTQSFSRLWRLLSTRGSRCQAFCCTRRAAVPGSSPYPASWVGRDREPCSSSIAELGTSRWAAGKPAYRRSSSLRSLGSPCRRPRELASLLSHWEGLHPSQTHPQSSQLKLLLHCL